MARHLRRTGANKFPPAPEPTPDLPVMTEEIAAEADPMVEIAVEAKPVPPELPPVVKKKKASKKAKKTKKGPF